MRAELWRQVDPENEQHDQEDEYCWMGRFDAGPRVDPSPGFEEFHPSHPVSHPVLHSRLALVVLLVEYHY